MKKYIIITLALVFSGLSMQAQSLQSIEDSESKINSIQRLIASLEVEDDHCEVPCGIYGDSLRISLLYEHVATIEKGMAQIKEISASAKPNYNQLVRWVMNKEHHAEEIQDIVSQYFLHQRIKLPPSTADGKARGIYTNKLANLHTILVNAMKAKQTTDAVYVENLRKAIHDFEHAYFGMHK